MKWPGDDISLYNRLYFTDTERRCTIDIHNDWFHERTVLAITYTTFDAVKNTFIFTIIALQLCEWIAMRFMIWVQVGRDQSEILYDYMNEDTSKRLHCCQMMFFCFNLSGKESSYRRREQALRKLMIISLIVLNVALFALDFLSKWSNITAVWAVLWMYALIALAANYNFLHMMFLMYRYCNFEYHRHRATLWSQFMFINLVCAARILFLWSRIYLIV